MKMLQREQETNLLKASKKRFPHARPTTNDAVRQMFPRRSEFSSERLTSVDLRTLCFIRDLKDFDKDPSKLMDSSYDDKSPTVAELPSFKEPYTTLAHY